MMSIQARQILILLLFLIFLFQTFLVYSDRKGRETPPLSAVASQGQKLWFQHNCQSCHQIYGFGGFLGPDLTNSAPKLTTTRLESILTIGSKQMPAFHFSKEEQNALGQFFKELNQTGVAQPLARKYPLPSELLQKVIEEQKQTFSVAENSGKEILLRERCIDCHLPNTQSLSRAPDLTTLTQQVREQRILEVLATGIPGMGMPKFKFSSQEKSDLIAFLNWLQKNQEAIQKGFQQLPTQKEPVQIPWFEYEK